MKLRTIANLMVTAGAVSVLGLGAAMAAPTGKVSGNYVNIKDGYNDDVKKSLAGADKIAAEKLTVTTENIGAEDLEKILADFPKMQSLRLQVSDNVKSVEALKNVSVSDSLTVKGKNVADLAPVSKFTTLTRVEVDSKMFDNMKWMAPLTSLKSAYITASPKVTSLEGVPNAPQLKDITIYNVNVKDLSPLNALSGVKNLGLRNSTVTDLSALSAMKTVEELSLYGSTSGDLTPLAAIPALKSLDIYATKGVDYNSLATLTQIQKLHTGMTDLTDLSWVKKTTSLKELRVFAEHVSDYSPIVGSSVDDLTIWQMRSPVDLTQLKDATNLKSLTLDGCSKGSDVTNTAVVATMTSLKKFTARFMESCNGELNGEFAKGQANLEELIIDKVPKVTGIENFGNLASLKKLKIARVNSGEAVDISFAGKLKNLTSLELSEVKISGFDALAGAEKLQYLDISKAQDVTSLKALKALPDLRTLNVKKGVFSEEELAGFANPKLKISQK
ncbi:MAG: hypothetical protein IJ523_00715 [Succinivibrionaceae bacterium]|nr:hypothetical protein [Succinivibrionaceae bacterium]